MDLYALAVSQFGKLSEAERRLIQSIVKGGAAVCGPNYDPTDPANNPASASDWRSDRVIRSEMIRWFCAHQEELPHLTVVHIFGAKIVGKLDASYSTVLFPIIFERCAIVGIVNLTSAKIPDLSFFDCHTQDILLENAEIKGNLLVKGTTVTGHVRLIAAQIGSTLNCRSSTFLNPDTSGHNDPDVPQGALDATRIRVAGGVFLRQVSAEGEVSLGGAVIGGDLCCTGGKFENLHAFALIVEKATIGGDVFLNDGFSAHGILDLSSASIGGNLLCIESEFDEVIFTDTVVKKTFAWSLLQNPKTTQLDLRNMVVGSLADDEQSWPARGNLHLDGFQYNRFTGIPTGNPFFEVEMSDQEIKETEQRLGRKTRTVSPIDAKTRLSWVGLDIQDQPAPYRQLAKVLSEMGDDEGAKQVLFAMERRLRLHDRNRLPMPDRLWASVSDELVQDTIGYGLYPRRAVWWSLGLVSLGWIIHRRAQHLGRISPTNEAASKCFRDHGKAPDHYQPFSPFIYSLENCVPLLKLGQDAQWAADPSPKLGTKARIDPTSKLLRLKSAWYKIVDLIASHPSRLRRLRWFMIIVGWVLATFIVAGLAGIIRAR